MKNGKIKGELHFKRSKSWHVKKSHIVNFLIVYTMAGLKKICSIYTIAVKILVGISLRISFVLYTMIIAISVSTKVYRKHIIFFLYNFCLQMG